MSRNAEAELIRRTLAGDHRAFEVLYKAHYDRVYYTIVRRIGDPDAVEDLVQNTFMRAFRFLRSFKGDAAFASWLTRIALNVCRSHTRSVQARQRWISGAEDPESISGIVRRAVPGEDPEKAVQEKEWKTLVMQGIQALPERYREALWLRYVHEWSYEEITDNLQVPLGTVKTWICRARRQLKGEFQEMDLQTIFS